MKNTKKQNPIAGAMLRFLGGIALLAAGVAIFYFHGIKHVGIPGWETSEIKTFFMGIWAYGGFPMSVLLSGAGCVTIAYAIGPSIKKIGHTLLHGMEYVFYKIDDILEYLGF